MKFFGRQNEIKELQEIRNLSLANGSFYNRNRYADVAERHPY